MMASLCTYSYGPPSSWVVRRTTLWPLATILLLTLIVTESLSFGLNDVWCSPRRRMRVRGGPSRAPPITTARFNTHTTIPLSAARRRGFGDGASDSNDGSSGGGMTTEALEALQSLADFHEGQWRGTAQSFTVTPDVAAGIVQRRQSPPYTCYVKLNKNSEGGDLLLTESLQWGDDNGGAESGGAKFSSRSISLFHSHVDIDAVDASYSLDSTEPDQLSIPSDILGTDATPKLMVEHCIAVSDDERARCFALYGNGNTNTDPNVDEEDIMMAKLARVVVLRETRHVDVGQENEEQSASSSSALEKLVGDGSPLTAADILEMESDIDRLVDKISGQISKEKKQQQQDKQQPSIVNGQQSPSSPMDDPMERLQRLQAASSVDSSKQQSSSSSSPPLDRHDVSLLELSSGVWLGDLIIRDQSVGKGIAFPKSKGFAASSASSSSPSSLSTSTSSFAEWEMGVQKSAWQWKWNFGDDILQDNNMGKAMGVGLAANAVPSIGLSGFVAVNEGLSSRRRRIKEGGGGSAAKRGNDDNGSIVYIDWSNDNVGFLLDNLSIQVPRYMKLPNTTGASSSTSQQRQRPPFWTEFGVYQREEKKSNGSGIDVAAVDGDESLQQLPDVICSKIARVYDSQGYFQQGCTSFYTLQRFGADDGQ